MSEDVPKRGLGAVAPGEAPTGIALLQALGGVRGIVESVLPGFAFLVVFAITKQPWVSVIVPAALALAFVIVRAFQRGPLMGSLMGLVLVGVSTLVVLLTGNANDNFVPGLWINIAFLLGCLVSLAARWPLVGILYGILTGDFTGWRKERRTRRAADVATAMWAGLFAIRLSAELPLYFLQLTEALSVVRLVTGVPLYAATLWLTWLLMRKPKEASVVESDAGVDAVDADPAPQLGASDPE